jgi:hypothetical protein
MKTAHSIHTVQCLLLGLLSAQAQDQFGNPNFENGYPVPVVGGEYQDEVTFDSALPSWTGSIGGVPLDVVIDNGYFFGGAMIEIFGPGWTNMQPGIIDGNETVMLQAGGPSPLSGGGNASISQYGTIPASAMSLQFKAWSMLTNATLAVTFQGNSLSPVLLSSGESPSGQPYDVYGVDVSAYARDTGELEFTDVFEDQGLNGIELDDITFSTTAVTPEPNTLALVVMGGLALAVRRWRKMRL